MIFKQQAHDASIIYVDKDAAQFYAVYSLLSVSLRIKLTCEMTWSIPLGSYPDMA